MADVVLVEAGLLIGLPVNNAPPSRKTTPTPATTLPSIGKAITMAFVEKLATKKDMDASPGQKAQKASQKALVASPPAISIAISKTPVQIIERRHIANHVPRLSPRVDILCTRNYPF